MGVVLLGWLIFSLLADIGAIIMGAIKLLITIFTFLVIIRNKKCRKQHLLSKKFLNFEGSLFTTNPLD